jgi:5-methylcytosine-specific restriction endonuclease McrA
MENKNELYKLNKELADKGLRKCSSCFEIKNFLEYTKCKNNYAGYMTKCKECDNIRKKKNKNSKQYKEYIKEYNNKRYNEIKKDDTLYGKILEKQRISSKKKYAENENHKIKIKNEVKEWKKKNPDKLKIQKKKYKEKNKLKCNISKSIIKKLKNKNASKNGKSTFNDILPYTVQELHNRLESLFEDGMAWDNYGKEWHIDHVIPDSWFKYESVEDEGFKKSWALENLQPMWSSENTSKGNRYSGKYRK